MVKEPRPGQVKTRLGRDIGMTRAAWWSRHTTAALLRRLQDPRWRLVLAVAPDRAACRSAVWPCGIWRRPQGGGDLGQRMRRIFHDIRNEKVCIVGTDIPEMTSRHIMQAFAALGGHDAVFGPACDGGYWLVGLKPMLARPARLFRDVRWSSPYALSDSVVSLSGYRIKMVSELNDVDTIADLV